MQILWPQSNASLVCPVELPSLFSDIQPGAVLPIVLYGCEEWSGSAQDTDQWRALVNTAMKLRFHKGGNILDQLSNS
jgi:hypothetical protein